MGCVGSKTVLIKTKKKKSRLYPEKTSQSHTGTGNGRFTIKNYEIQCLEPSQRDTGFNIIVEVPSIDRGEEGAHKNKLVKAKTIPAEA
jgi:hypothetical protein